MLIKLIIYKYFFFVILNAICISWIYADDINSEQHDLAKGVIYSAKSVYVVTEPKSRTTMYEGKKNSNSHIPFSWLSRLVPMGWFDYKITIDSFSRILTDVKIKLTDGTFKTLPKVLLRQTDFVREDPTDERQLKKYIIDVSQNKPIKVGRQQIKAVLTYSRKQVLLSKFTKSENDNVNIYIGNVKIMTLSGYKNQEGIYEYENSKAYNEYLDYGLLSFNPHIDESMDENKYSERN